MAKEKDVNTSDGHDEVIEDLNDFASSDEELETHNPDIDEYDAILKELEADEEPEGDSPGAAEKTDEPEGKSKDDAPGTKDDDKDDARIPKTRLDEVISQREAEKEARLIAETKLSTLEERLAKLEASSVRTKEPEPKSLPLDDLLSSGDPQQVVDAFTENPHEFLSNLEARIEARNAMKYEQMREEEEQTKALKSRLDEFAARHEDFIPAIPQLSKTLGDNPIHNAISAYYEVVKMPALEAQITDLQSKIESARTEGVKQGRKEAIEAVRAKGLAATLDGSHGGEAPTPDSELDNTDEAGGTRNVLTRQLLERRKAQGVV